MNYKSSMTDVGNEMIAQAHKDDKAIIFDSFLVSEALSDTGVELTKTTKNLFSNPLTYPINSKATSDNTFTVKAVLANKTDKFTVDEDFSINVIGVIAHIDGSSDSRLITIAVAEGTGAVITAFRDTLYSLTVAITQAYKADQPANFGLANVAYALADDLDKLKTDIQIIIDGGLTNVAKINEENTFTEVQKFDKGATDGEGNAYVTTKDVATGLNNGLSTKVTDNKNGTEQLNGVKVQPFNKLSDTIGGRNLAPNTSGDWQKVSAQSGWGTTFLCDPIYEILDGKTYTLQIEVRNMTSSIRIEIFGYNSAGKWVVNLAAAQKADKDGKIIITFTANLPKGYAYFRPDIAFSQSLTSAGSYEYRRFKFAEGSVATDWTPAPEDKVNVSDMRKPASDVAGIEEVNAKQNKIGYTPADDSKVFHSTITQLNSTDMNTVKTTGFYKLNSGTNGMPNGDAYVFYQVINFSGANGVQFAYGTNSIILGMRSWYGWKYFTSWVQFADDSKVAHLSGANNFDTVPTVNNNPLLLASSLPSDLARTGQDANFTGKLQQNGQDVALANNTIDRNPDTGVVSEPVDFTKLTVNGGKSVATRDDLKSVIDNSWLPIKIADGWTSTPVLMKYDKTNGKTIITGMMSKPFGVSDGTCTEALLTLPDGFYWNKVDNSMIGIDQANILEATINPDNKKELIVSYKWKWSSPASGNAFVGYNEAYSIGGDEKVTGTYYETTSISQA